MLVYVENIINLSHDLKEDMYALNCTYILKEEIIGTPTRYIGENAEKVQMDNEKECW